ncbi:MAG: hypothetical protein H7A23_22285 [Leptospiraceae bacterium]|nr:hypothetical protein [Leptospiraceae bacterium]MCP5497291.1 hypothetical protein [Leptospiraceae bacterium]
MKTKIIAVLVSFIFSNCSSLDLGRYNNFGDWFLGQPGYRGTYFGYEPTGKTKKGVSQRSSGSGGSGSIPVFNCKDCGKESLVVVAVIVAIVLIILYTYHTKRALGDYDDPDKYEDMYCSNIINEYRHPLFLWLRTPEHIFNPQGGAYFPEVQERTFSKKGKKCVVNQTFKRGEKTDFEFQVMEAGIIDAAIPYRIWTAEDKDIPQKLGLTVANTVFILPANIVVKVFNLPFYVAHDIAKLSLIPVAFVYYNNGEDGE